MSKSKIDQWTKALLKKLFNKAANEAVKVIKEEVKKETKKEPKKEDGAEYEKTHSWRLCPIGEHWVTDHPLWVPPTDKRPGYHTTRDGHCATNPTRGKSKVIKDYLTAEEMQMIADKHFSNLSGPPASGKLPEYVVGADNFDHFIRGWTKYWNDVFKPDEPLDPDLVKALIATESSFELKPLAPNAGIAGKAHGLIQLTDQAIKALGDPKGELLNHLVKISTEDTSDPNLSIGAAVRWLCRKRDLASHRLKRQATWREAIAEYKSYLPDMVSGKDPNPEQMQKLDDIYKRLKK
jgi:hypothetical protein